VTDVAVGMRVTCLLQNKKVDCCGYNLDKRFKQDDTLNTSESVINAINDKGEIGNI